MNNVFLSVKIPDECKSLELPKSHVNVIRFILNCTQKTNLIYLKDKKLVEKAKRLRWFGIDRSKKQLGVWENDVKELGYKYQMNDISASLGLAGLKDITKIIKKRIFLFKEYEKNLNHNLITIIGKSKTKKYKSIIMDFA